MTGSSSSENFLVYAVSFSFQSYIKVTNVFECSGFQSLESGLSCLQFSVIVFDVHSD